MGWRASKALSWRHMGLWLLSVQHQQVKSHHQVVFWYHAAYYYCHWAMATGKPSTIAEIRTISKSCIISMFFAKLWKSDAFSIITTYICFRAFLNTFYSFEGLSWGNRNELISTLIANIAKDCCWGGKQRLEIERRQEHREMMQTTQCLTYTAAEFFLRIETKHS